jgi:hypothetical protein
VAPELSAWTTLDDLRADEDVVLEAPFVTQVAQQEGRVVIRNIGTGPALNVQFTCRQATSGGFRFPEGHLITEISILKLSTKALAVRNMKRGLSSRTG